MVYAHPHPITCRLVFLAAQRRLSACRVRTQCFLALALLLLAGLPILSLCLRPSHVIIGVPRVIDGDSLEVRKERWCSCGALVTMPGVSHAQWHTPHARPPTAPGPRHAHSARGDRRARAAPALQGWARPGVRVRGGGKGGPRAAPRRGQRRLPNRVPGPLPPRAGDLRRPRARCCALGAERLAGGAGLGLRIRQARPQVPPGGSPSPGPPPRHLGRPQRVRTSRELAQAPGPKAGMTMWGGQVFRSSE